MNRHRFLKPAAVVAALLVIGLLVGAAAAAAVITATKTDTLVVDHDNDSQADPGDVISYTVVIQNSGDTDATNVAYADTIDANTTLTQFDVGTGLKNFVSSPMARNDSFASIGNVGITVPAGSGLLVNDNDPDGGSVTISAFDATSANGGNVSVAADGSLTYNPAPGFEGTDTFAYQVTDDESETDGATVTITVSDMIWFVDAAATCPCDGRLSNPFNDLAVSANSFDLNAADDPNDIIFVADGAYNGGLTLLSGQLIVGDGSSSDLATITGFTPPSFSVALPAFGGTDPIISSTANGINLGQNNTIRGLTVGNTPSGFGISGSTVGIFNILETSVNGTGGALNVSTSGTAGTVSFDQLSSSNAPGQGINLINVNGTIVFNLGSITNASGDAVHIDGGNGLITYNGTITNSANNAVEVRNRSGGTVSFTGAIDEDGTGILLDSNGTGTISFSGGLDIDSITNPGFTAIGGGTVNVTGSSNTINTTTGIGLRVENTTIGASDLNFQSISVNGAADGILLNTTGSSGGLKVTGTVGSDCGASGTHSACTGGILQNTTGNAVSLTSTANVSLNNMRIDDTGHHAIFGTGVLDGSGGVEASFELIDSEVLNAGDANGEDAIFFKTAATQNIVGAMVLHNVLVQDFHERGVSIENNSGTLAVTIENSTFDDNHDTDGTQAIDVDTEGTANITLNVLNSTANDLEGSFVLYWADGSGTNDINLVGNTSTNHGGPDDFPNPAVFGLHTESHSASLTFDIQGNTLTDSGDGILILGGGTIEGRIGGPNVSDGNVIAGTHRGDGIRLDIGGTSLNPASGNATILVQNNDITSGGVHTLADDALQILHRDTTGILNLTIEDNIFANSVSEAIRFFGDEDAGLGAGNPTANVRIVDNEFTNTSTGSLELDMILRMRDTANACFHVSANDNGAGGSPGEIDLDQGDTSTLQITQASIAALSSANNGATVSTNGSITFNGPCTNPTLPGNARTISASSSSVSNFPKIKSVNPVSSSEIVGEENIIVEFAQVGRLVSANYVAVAPVPAEERPVVDNVSAIEAAGVRSGESLNVSLGTLNPGQMVTITFRVTVDNPQNPNTNSQVCNQGLFTGDNFANVLTDDPDVGGASDPTCTSLDTGTIVIEKVTNPVGGTAFDFTDDIVAPNSFTLDDGQSQTFLNVAPGTYTVTEGTASEYILTDLVCDDGASGAPSTVDEGTATATINVESGETVTCTFTNLALSMIAGFKFHDLNGNGVWDNPVEPGLAGVDFVLTGTDMFGTAVNDSTVSDANGEFWFTDLVSGTYTLTEVVPPGFVATTPTLYNTDLQAGEAHVAYAGLAGLSPGDPQFEVVVGASLMFGNVENLPPVLSNVSLDSSVDENGTATLTGNLSDAENDALTLTVDWGDGVTETFNYAGGTTSLSENHQYLDDDPSGTPSDSYAVDLTVQDAFGGTGTDSAAIIVDNLAPTLSSVAVTPAVDEGSTITLTGSIADVGTLDSFVLTVDWGDGSAPENFSYSAGTTAFTETYQYLDDDPSGTPSDSYTVNLTLTDDDTGSATDSASVMVNNVTPSLENLAASPLVLVEGSTITLTGDIVDLGSQDTFTLTVDWGDNSTPESFSFPAGITAFTETHQYLDDEFIARLLATRASFAIGVTLEDDDTGSDADSVSVEVNNDPPAAISVSASAVLENGVSTLTGDLSDLSPLDTFTLTVDWGDGATPEVFNYPAGTTMFTETHQYLDDDPTGTAQDDYTIDLTLEDDDGGASLASTTVMVSNVAPTLSNLAVTTPIDENGVATLSGDIDDPGTMDSFGLTVDWGDGSTPEIFNYPAGTTAFTESHQYLDDNPTSTPSDSYTVAVTLADDDTGSTAGSDVVTVDNVAPEVYAGPDQEAGVGAVVQFQGVFTDVGTLDTHQIEWDMGDGTIITGTLAPSHAFAAKQVYTVTLTITDDDGGVTSAQVVIDVNRFLVFMPIVLRNFAVAPDLVVSDLQVGSDEVLVVISNLGNAPAADFWVDVYIDPSSAPTAVNQTWDQLAEQGLVWGVETTLEAGGVLTLTMDSAFYHPEYSNFAGSLLAGTPVYAQVDSAGTDASFGGVLENHEILGGVYNNITGPVLSTVGTLGRVIQLEPIPVLKGALPSRP